MLAEYIVAIIILAFRHILITVYKFEIAYAIVYNVNLQNICILYREIWSHHSTVVNIHLWGMKPEAVKYISMGKWIKFYMHHGMSDACGFRHISNSKTCGCPG